MHKGFGMFGIVVVDFSNDKIYPGRTNYNFWTAFHQWGMILCWTIGVDLFIFAGRYIKTIAFYHYIHSVGFVSISAITIVSVYGLWSELTSNGNFWVYPGFQQFSNAGFVHYSMGVTIICMIFFQMIGGVNLWNKLVSRSFENVLIKTGSVGWFRLSHNVFGGILWILTRINCWIGTGLSFDLFLRYNHTPNIYYKI